MNASQQLAAWIQSVHPVLYSQLYAHAIRQGVTRRPATLRGLGDDSLAEITVTADAIPNDPGSYNTDPNLQSVGVDTSAISAPNIATPDVSGSTIGGSILGAAGAVGNWLTTGGGLNAIANVGAAYLKTQAVEANAQLQTQVLQAQVARAQAGLPPLPISYATGANGQVIPIYGTGSPTGIAPSAGVISVAHLPSALNSAIVAGTAQPVVLPDGSTGYAVHPTVLTALLGGTGIPVWMWLLGGALALAVIAR